MSLEPCQVGQITYKSIVPTAIHCTHHGYTTPRLMAVWVLRLNILIYLHTIHIIFFIYDLARHMVKPLSHCAAKSLSEALWLQQTVHTLKHLRKVESVECTACCTNCLANPLCSCHVNPIPNGWRGKRGTKQRTGKKVCCTVGWRF